MPPVISSPWFQPGGYLQRGEMFGHPAFTNKHTRMPPSPPTHLYRSTPPLTRPHKVAPRISKYNFWNWKTSSWQLFFFGITCSKSYIILHAVNRAYPWKVRHTHLFAQMQLKCNRTLKWGNSYVSKYNSFFKWHQNFPSVHAKILYWRHLIEQNIFIKGFFFVRI